jgi:hypothetical protein
MFYQVMSKSLSKLKNLKSRTCRTPKLTVLTTVQLFKSLDVNFNRTIVSLFISNILNKAFNTTFAN